MTLIRSQFEWDKERLKAFALKVADVAVEGAARPWSAVEAEVDALCSKAAAQTADMASRALKAEDAASKARDAVTACHRQMALMKPCGLERCDDLLCSEQGCHDDIAALLRFYDCHTFRELILLQDVHVERLQTRGKALTEALALVAGFSGKTLICVSDKHGQRCYSNGANAAFEECAAIARAALDATKAQETTTQPATSATGQTETKSLEGQP